MYVVIGALLIGLSLGLLGSGGSILTVPVLVYLLGHDDKAAIAESLGIVGAIALIGAIPYTRTREVDWRNVLLFGLPGMAGTYGGAWLSQFVTGAAQLTLFAVVMLAAAWLMFRQPAARSDAGKHANPVERHAAWKIVLEGLAVGVLTGLVGVGGGFLIVPALVLLGQLPMRRAVATSLPIVALKSFSGFFTYLAVLNSQDIAIDWNTIGLFVLLGTAGSLVGNVIGSRVNQRSLRRVFAVFLVGMGIFVLAKEAPRVFTPPAVGNAVSSPSPVAAASPARRPLTYTNPLITEYGKVVRLPDAAHQPRQGAKIVVDVTKGDFPDKLNQAVGKAARFVNIYGGAGAKPATVKIALVMHGDATLVVLSPNAYSARFGGDGNPNLDCLRRLHEEGVEIYVCGQSLVEKGARPEDVADFADVAVSALTALVNLQGDGYAYVPLK
jgi:uncharacterized protein